MTLRQLIWPITLITSAVALWMLIWLGDTSPVRVLLAAWVFFVCPGMAYVQSLHIEKTLERWALAIALSLIIDTLLALAILYLGVWSWQLGLSLIMAVTAVGIAIYIYRLRMSLHQHAKIEAS